MDMSLNRLGDEGAKCLAEFLRQNKRNSIVSISLGELP